MVTTSSWQRTAPSLLLAIALAVAALITLGPPDFTGAGQLLSGAYPSKTSALALVGVICWLALAGMLLGTVLGAARSVSDLDLAHHRVRRALICLFAGILLFAMGVFQHNRDYRLCCAGGPALVQEAEQLAR